MSRGVGAGILAALACLGLASPAAAQIVNVLNETPAEPGEGFGGRVAASGKWVSGNVDQTEVEGSLSLRYRYDRHLWLLFGSGAFGQLNGERSVNKSTAHFRYRVDIVDPLQLEAFVQTDRNEFRRRESRTVFGGGPRVELLRGPVMWLAFGLSYMPELEVLSEGPYLDSGLSRWHHRLSLYNNSTVRLHERLALLFTVYVQPAVDEIDNLRAFSDLSFRVTVLDGLQLTLSHSLQLDTEPPITVQPVDADRRMTLSFAW